MLVKVLNDIFVSLLPDSYPISYLGDGSQPFFVTNWHVQAILADVHPEAPTPISLQTPTPLFLP